MMHTPISFPSVALLLASSHLLFASPLHIRSSSPPTVQIDNGIVLMGNLSSNIESFFNIKFGQDTSGQNRFAAPNPFAYPKDTVVNASTPGAACPQQKVPVPGLPIFGNVTNISEDCLTLRVDRPVNTTAADKLPVMVYIYGGGFVIGQTYDATYSPVGLLLGAAEKKIPVIYVGINYRVGVFGFAASPAIEGEQSLNAGLLDQRLGLEWVQENIQYFGGDSNNVTIFGESAGAFSVSLHVTSYGGTRDPMFHRAIMESGSSTSVQGIAGGVAANHTAELTTLVNCTSTDQNSTTELECLRNLPLTSLLTTAISYELAVAPPIGIEAFIPTVDGTFIPNSPSQLLLSGNFHKNIDLIAGWNENDGSIFVTATLNYTTDQELIGFLHYNFPNLSPNTTNQILSLYPLSDSTSQATPNATAQYFRASQIERDQHFACPAIHLIQSMTNYSSDTNKVYLYQLDASLFTPALATIGDEFLGVCHGSDIPFVFNQASTYGASAADVELASQMSGSWALFANNGIVDSGNGNLTVQGWQTAETKSALQTDLSVMVLGGNNSGMAIYDDTNGSGGVLADQKLAQRCAFWNSEAVSKELAV